MWINLAEDDLMYMRAALSTNVEREKSIADRIDDWMRTRAPELDDKYIYGARNQYACDGECEIDDDAIVSKGSDNGAYVMAWVWVDNDDAGIDTEIESSCDACGKTVEHIIGCPDGREVCQDCFDNGVG